MKFSMFRAPDLGHSESPDALRTIYKITRKWRDHNETTKGRSVAPPAIMKEGEFPQTLCMVSLNLILCVAH